MGRRSRSGGWDMRRERLEAARGGRVRPPKRRGKKRPPRPIDRIEPASETKETPREAVRRRKRSRKMVDPAVRKRRHRRVLLVVLSVLLVVLVGAGGALWWWFANLERALHPTIDADPELARILDPNVPKKPGAPFYMVIMGVDTRPEEKVARSDTLLVARVDPVQKRVLAMSIPRDSYVSIPGHGKQKVNAAMQLGGPKLVVKTVKQLTGLPISEFASVNFNGFKDIVDAVGGVRVYVPITIKDLQAANWHRSAYYIPKGWQTLDGMHALTFVRARRQFPSQDLQRVANQQAFMKALAKSAIKMSNPFKLPALINSIAKNVDTSLKLAEFYGLARDFRDMPEKNIETVTMPGSLGAAAGLSVIRPDMDGMRAIVAKMKKGQSFGVAAKQPVDPLALKPAQITVTVRNGAGVSGIANIAADKLRKLGYRVLETGNMSQFVYGKTLIVYKTDTMKAQMVREAVGVGDIVASRGMYVFKTDILVVIGKDWDPKKFGVTPASPRR